MSTSLTIEALSTSLYLPNRPNCACCLARLIPAVPGTYITSESAGFCSSCAMLPP